MSEVSFTGRTIELTPEQMRQNHSACLLTRQALDHTSYDLAEIPDEAFVEPANDEELCAQIAEPGGLHTCDMTSTVNAFIWQGWLNKSQGDEVHDRFPTFQPDREFTRKDINGQTVLIAGREEDNIQAITREKLFYAASFMGEVPKDEATARILGTLANGVVLNVANSNHSRLAVGYIKSRGSTQLKVADPYSPNNLRFMPIDTVVAFHPSTSLFAVAKKSESLAYRPDIPYA